MVFNRIAATGATALSWVQEFGRAGLFLLEAVGCMITVSPKLSNALKQFHFFGWGSLVVVSLTGFFTGMVLGLQGFNSLRRVGSEAFLGPLVALSLIRELGPVIAALMVMGRAGSAVTAQIGIMRNTEQIDAMELMGLNPFRYVVVPSFLGAFLALPLLVAVFDVVGIFGGYLVGVRVLGLSSGTYFGEMTNYIDPADVLGGIYKAMSFGVIIAWISCFKGYTTKFGAEGVSAATTQAVVAASVLILVWDYFMTSLLF